MIERERLRSKTKRANDLTRGKRPHDKAARSLAVGPTEILPPPHINWLDVVFFNEKSPRPA